MAINNDIDPGPAIIGIAKGVNAMSLRCCASLATFLFTPRFLLNVPESNPNPEEQITIPPAILNTSMSIPKKLSMYCPIKKETVNIINTLIATHIAVRSFHSLLSSCVNAKKIGTDPNGLINENKAVKAIKNTSIFLILKLFMQ